ncbi:hypothetical protein BGS_0413 [Beggiatoa sp. SS]|nr:hypothetical protein BGS_0413 [Beggiatoa sp. SS]
MALIKTNQTNKLSADQRHLPLSAFYSLLKDFGVLT